MYLFLILLLVTFLVLVGGVLSVLASNKKLGNTLMFLRVVLQFLTIVSLFALSIPK
ncbi:HIG1 domain-containing protein [Neorickettsia sp. 179522]|uniref:HIG1 domain-containing protein n=1 Tax=Neorickettsia sp. 179522 TaxID=1714371 RepID=UPI000A422334